MAISKQNFLGIGILVLLVLPLLAESISYTGAIANNLGMPALGISVVLTLIAFTQRAKLKISPKLAFLGGWITLISSTVLGYIESLHFPNYIYGKLHLNFEALIYVSMIWFLTGVLFSQKKWLQEHYNKLIFTSGIIGVIYGFAFWFVPLGMFFELVKEGKQVETLQFLSLLLISGISFFSAKKAMNLTSVVTWQKYLYLAFFITTGLGALLLAGEEVAWGQHWLGYTVESIQKNNLQNEVTIHNNSFFSQFILQAYLVLTIYGSFSWVAAKLLGNKVKTWFFAFTEWYTMPFFLLFPLHQLQQRAFDLGELVKQWSEYTELMLYIGILFTVLKNLSVILNFAKKR